MRIRPSHAQDAPGLAQVYGHHVKYGFGTFEETPPTAEEMAARLASVQSHGLPYLIAEDDDGLLGFAYAAPFRMRSAYRYTVEDSIYLTPSAIGRKIGRALLSAVLLECERLGLRQVTAVIGDSANMASIGLHSALGFERTGSSTAVGFKHGRWVDIVFMQKSLNGGSTTLPNAPGLTL